MTRLLRNYVGAKLITTDALLTNSPTNVDNVNVFNSGGNHVVLQSDEDEIGPLALQAGKPVEDLESGVGGYGGFMHMLTARGQRIATIGADYTSDGHNHMGFYTNDGINSDGSDSQPVKRLNIQGGEPTTSIDGYGVNEFRYGPRGQPSNGNLDFIMDGNADQSCFVTMRNDGQTKVALAYREDWDQLRLYNYVDDSDVRIGDGNGDLTVRNKGPANGGAIGFGTGGAKVYVDGGNVYAMNANGDTTMVI